MSVDDPLRQAELGPALDADHFAGEAYADVSHFWSDLFGVTLHAWGESRHVHHRLVRGNPNAERGHDHEH